MHRFVHRRCRGPRVSVTVFGSPDHTALCERRQSLSSGDGIRNGSFTPMDELKSGLSHAKTRKLPCEHSNAVAGETSTKQYHDAKRSTFQRHNPSEAAMNSQTADGVGGGREVSCRNMRQRAGDTGAEKSGKRTTSPIPSSAVSTKIASIEFCIGQRDFGVSRAPKPAVMTGVTSPPSSSRWNV